MPKAEQKLTRQQAEARLALLTDRMAVLLCVVRKRHGDSWDPWIGEGMWEDADSLGEETRSWPDYQEALKIVELFITRSER